MSFWEDILTDVHTPLLSYLFHSEVHSCEMIIKEKNRNNWIFLSFMSVWLHCRPSVISKKMHKPTTWCLQPQSLRTYFRQSGESMQNNDNKYRQHKEPFCVVFWFYFDITSSETQLIAYQHISISSPMGVEARVEKAPMCSSSPIFCLP